jgi:hypothetical protein
VNSRQIEHLVGLYDPVGWRCIGVEDSVGAEVDGDTRGDAPGVGACGRTRRNNLKCANDPSAGGEVVQGINDA